jgi:hypothetical protein
LVWLLAPVVLAFLGVATWELVRDPSRPRRKPFFRVNGRGTSTAAMVVLILTLAVWLLRFAGYFGGPVEVTTLRSWLAR